jgi:hypothetical protein
MSTLTPTSFISCLCLLSDLDETHRQAALIASELAALGVEEVDCRLASL